jgi:hypothetical protein
MTSSPAEGGAVTPPPQEPHDEIEAIRRRYASAYSNLSPEQQVAQQMRDIRTLLEGIPSQGGDT